MREEGKKYDQGKLRYDLIPAECIQEVAKVLTMGAEKYGANSWQNLPDANTRYYAALERHIQAWRMGEDKDSESGLSHLAHVAVNAIFLLHNTLNKTEYIK